MANYIEGESNDGRVNLIAKGKGPPQSLLRFDVDGRPARLDGLGFEDDTVILDADVPPYVTILAADPNVTRMYHVDLLIIGRSDDPTAGVVTLTLWFDSVASSQSYTVTYDLAQPLGAASFSSLSVPVQLTRGGGGLYYEMSNSGIYGTAYASLLVRITPLG